MRVIHALPLAFLLGACATSEPEPATVDPVATVKKQSPERIKSQPLKHLLGRNLKPIPDHELDVRTKCSFRDVAGGRGSMDLQVTKAEVKRFVAEVTIPKQGMCRFDMKNFVQTARLPNVVLTDAASGCVVRMWEQEKGVTIAFNACQSKCGGDAFSYLWPIMVDTRNGRCS
ncbi:hypothetical protein [Propionivibrio sp.]|uniref:hypothetical protein n=1 Tax=Propionivibrio sp. TaxID=2212460 RepID=UPI003BF435B2